LQNTSQSVLRKYIQQRSPAMAVELKEKSNFSRFLRMWRIMKANDEVKQLLLANLKEEGIQTKWSLEKVVYFF
jgi:hypothetical protein